MNEIITRQKALLLDIPFYFTGQPCKRGHLVDRTAKKGECVECKKITRQEHYQANKEDYHQRHNKWKADNAERHTENQQRWQSEHKEQQRVNHKRWRDTNRVYYNIQQSTWARNNKTKRTAIMAKYRENILVRISTNLRSRLNMAIRTHAKTGSAVRDLGCSIEQFRNYITALFTPEMTWKNWGSVWQLDHIRPLMSFNLAERSNIVVACHFSNMQPLLIEDHKIKTATDFVQFYTPGSAQSKKL